VLCFWPIERIIAQKPVISFSLLSLDEPLEFRSDDPEETGGEENEKRDTEKGVLDGFEYVSMQENLRLVCRRPAVGRVLY
jgi:hypothetical protein